MQRAPMTPAAIALHSLSPATFSTCTRLANSISRRTTLIPTETAPTTAPQSMTTSRIPATDLWPRGIKPKNGKSIYLTLIWNVLQIIVRQRSRRLRLSQAGNAADTLRLRRRLLREERRGHHGKRVGRFQPFGELVPRKK